MSIVYILIFGSMIVLGASAIYALFWAAKDGQFSDMKTGASVIFSGDEPEGIPTDVVFRRRKDRRKSKESSQQALLEGQPPESGSRPPRGKGSQSKLRRVGSGGGIEPAAVAKPEEVKP